MSPEARRELLTNLSSSIEVTDGTEVRYFRNPRHRSNPRIRRLVRRFAEAVERTPEELAREAAEVSRILAQANELERHHQASG